NLWRKTYAYEASARVPFIVKAPPSIEAKRNREIDHLVGWEDIMPTFLDIAGAPIPDTVEGKSILPLLRGEEDNWRTHYHGEHAPCYHPENANQFLTDQKWKYIWNPITGDEQLFDLKSDPNECHDLSQDPNHSQTLSQWHKRLAQQLKDRVENLSDGKTLTPGKVPAWVGGDTEDVHLG
ncbi:MAG: DUF4976 domain-containing protein, partial [Candidatus Latescibacteria bacterium]|nr:DUF4976 domain-containing protein [Candidatus Latescibacterota bacterium]